MILTIDEMGAEMKYKIGEVSKILNIPVETLRFYEKQNIVNPQKDPYSNYRYYDAWDINYLLEYKKYRGMKYSSKEIQQILQKDSLEDFLARLEAKQEEYERKRTYYDLLMVKNLNYQNVLLNAKENIGTFTLTESPELYYFIHRYNDQYESVDKFDGLFEAWMEYYPFIENMIRIEREVLLNRKERNDYQWGFGIKRYYARELNIPIAAQVTHLPSRPSIYTMLTFGERGTFTLSAFEPALAYMEREGLEVAGDVIGNLILRAHNPDGYTRYIETWIPVKKK